VNRVHIRFFDCYRGEGGIGSRGDSRGFTLIELLTVMAIISILAAMAGGGFQPFVVAARISDGTSVFRSALELARSEAAVRGTRVGVCRSTNANDNGATCSQAAVGNFAGNDWSAGWIIYAKAPANALDTFEAGDILIRRQSALSSADLASRLMIWAPGAGAIVYNWNGMRLAGPAGNFAFDFGQAVASLPPTLSSSRARCLSVNIAGRIDLREPVGGSCPT